MAVIRSVILCEIVCDLTYGLYVLSSSAKNARKNGCTSNVKQALKVGFDLGHIRLLTFVLLSP